ncbi:MAG TPA: HAD-IB family hydrolase [Streptosporangiaceae bacterium]|jgi:putative phosphoserine phosphatase/1-acylglycerol-3-phosphate O-acyltransferase|nr:HAD-IB family hydrolase [Streptosporangiaceae bacterium]
MTALEERLRQIHASSAGKKIGAFFDYDGTLINGFSYAAIYRRRLRRLEVSPVELARTLLLAARGIDREEDFEAILALTRPALTGRTVQQMTELGEDLFKHETGSMLRPAMWQVVQAHRERGHRIVVASSATPFQVGPIAREIQADHVLCTQFEVDDGVLTGRVQGRTLWGPGKAAAVRALAREHDIDLAESFAYSDGNEDVPYLEAVGHPAVVCPQHGLRAEADSRGWPVLDVGGPGGPPLPLLAAGTAAFYLGAAWASAAGLALSVAKQDPGLLTSAGLAPGAQLGLSLAGVRIRVADGAEYLESARPCVFVFNHQSKLDVPILGALLRKDITGVAKQEVRSVPAIGRLMAMAGMVFIDRSDTARAIEAMAPAVAKLRDEGISLVIAPEGTRSITPRVGPFKKGAFHIAMQAGVPVVPIVIRNAGELMWRGSQLVRPGTVEVIVLPPVDTSGWTAAHVGQYAQDVREMFVRTLADWPGER